MRVLVVEDNPEHLREAVRILSDAGVTVETATNAHDGLKKMRRPKPGSREWRPEYEAAVDAIISDVYMPYSDDAAYRHDKDPCGVLVVAEAKKLGVPVVFCTSGYHHGDKFQWIFELGKSLEISMVDGGQSRHSDPEPTSKDWKKALEWLLPKKE